VEATCKTPFLPRLILNSAAPFEEYGFKFDRRIREEECSEITSLSRSSRWKMEQQGRFPPRCHFGRNSCAGFFLMCSGGFVIRLQ
jgi:hypothetical protein